MERADRVAFCERCIKREFSPQKGIICSLTMEQADFQGNCKGYSEDIEEAGILDQKREELANQVVQQESLGLTALGISNGITAGFMTMFLAIAWFAIGYFYMDRIFFYPPILFVIGIITAIRGVNKKKRKKVVKNNEDLLDDF